MLIESLIEPRWEHPPTVRAVTTTRQGGCSRPPFAEFNLATHVGDDPDQVAHNRAQLRQLAQLPAEPLWLNQIHGCNVATVGADAGDCSADASIARAPGQVCAVLTADCLPILLCETNGRAVAAIHAGWRGLAAGVIEQTVAQLGHPPVNLSAWLGPAIGPTAFEVGAEVRERFCDLDSHATVAFQPTTPGHWLANLPQLAQQRLTRLRVRHIANSGLCTVSDPTQFFSYRRDGRTGRMATVIWLIES